MKFLGAKSYDNGIDFNVKTDTEGYIFAARRNERDEVKISLRGRYTKVKTISFWEYIIALVTTLLFVVIHHFFKGMQNENLIKLGWVLGLGAFWLGLVSFLYIHGKNPKNHSTGRYHSVEHKILNFHEKYGYLPRTTDDIEKMPSIYISCGSTLVVVFALLGTLSMLSILWIPTILFKIVGIIISAGVTMYCWANGKCDFAKKWLLQRPTHKEIELGVYAMHKLAKEINVL